MMFYIDILDLFSLVVILEGAKTFLDQIFKQFSEKKKWARTVFGDSRKLLILSKNPLWFIVLWEKMVRRVMWMCFVCDRENDWGWLNLFLVHKEWLLQSCLISTDFSPTYFKLTKIAYLWVFSLTSSPSHLPIYYIQEDWGDSYNQTSTQMLELQQMCANFPL